MAGHRPRRLIVFTGATVLRPLVAKATDEVPPGNPCLLAPEDVNHASIRLDGPSDGAQLPVDERGQVTVAGVVHKQASMVDAWVDSVTTSASPLGPPPEDVSAWASSWTARVRPPHLGSARCACGPSVNRIGSRGFLRTVTVVDLIPPSAVPGLAVRAVTSTSAKVTWGDATDNYGLAGYEIRVDGGTAIRTTVDTHSYSITNMSSGHRPHGVPRRRRPGRHRSTTPATVSFTTPAVPPHNDVDIQSHEGYAIVSWHPDLDADVTYKSFLDGAALEDFPLDRYCQGRQRQPGESVHRAGRDQLSGPGPGREHPVRDPDPGGGRERVAVARTVRYLHDPDQPARGAGGDRRAHHQ
jgi:hypothetical protein